VELRNKILGIIGLGNVGSAVARRAQGLEMRVIAYDPYVSPDYARNLRVEMVSLEDLLRTADFITLHLPLNETTRGFLDEKKLALVKPTARIINTARGGLIDEIALYRALEEGRIAGAAIDVFAEEPTSDNILFKSNKVIVTPHIAGSTAEAQTNVALDIANQVIAVLQGQPAPYAVNAPLIPPEHLPFLGPYICVAQVIGRLAAQLAEGQMIEFHITYEGEIGQYDTAAIKAGILSGILETASAERVNLVNAPQVAQRRGIRVIEEKGGASEVYPSLITLRLQTTQGTTTVAGTLIRNQAHIVRVNDFWLDVVPTGGYFLFCDHRDRPGLIGAIGTITGKANINIHSMHLSRLEPRGQALMVLGLDEPLPEEQRVQILSIPDIYTAKLVKL
jgi:D-3-phosphoglycerate dehydrogenase